MTVLWQHHQRTEDAQKLYALALADQEAHPEDYLLEADRVIIKALGQNPPFPLDDQQWREGLEVYISSAREEGRLNALGAKTMLATAVGRLRAGHAILDYMEQYPHVRKKQIHRPIRRSCRR